MTDFLNDFLKINLEKMENDNVNIFDENMIEILNLSEKFIAYGIWQEKESLVTFSTCLIKIM